MAVNTSAFTGVLLNWAKSGVFWIVIIIVGLLALVGGLYIRKRRRLIYPCIVETKQGNQKAGASITKAGELKNKNMFFGLINYGNESAFYTQDGRKILGASLDDLHEINGRMGFRVYRKPDDPKILVPIKKVYYKDEYLVNQIAPADYRDASSSIVESAVKETQTTWERIQPIVIFGALIIFSLIVILFIIQFANKQVDTASQMILKAGQVVADANTRANIAGSVAP